MPVNYSTNIFKKMCSRGRFLVKLAQEENSSDTENHCPNTSLEQALARSPIFDGNDFDPGFDEVDPAVLLFGTTQDGLPVHEETTTSANVQYLENTDGDILAIHTELKDDANEETTSMETTVLKEVNLSVTIESNVTEQLQTDAEKNISPVRKKFRNENNWKVKIAKKRRNTGQEYTSYATKKIVKARKIKESCVKKKYQMECYQKISEDQRKNIFYKFWKLGNHDKHMDFLSKHVKKMQKKAETVNTNSRRQFTMEYYFTVDELIIKVCKTFFLNTLSITDIWIRTVMLKLDRNTIGIGSSDGRGRVTSTDPKVEATRKFIRQHIECLPTTESHYIRKESNPKYLQVDIQSIAQMYRLYLEWA
ncbi:uncharacterized protein LOC126746280 [Anthonomus grandis grandis]|uniref:uncharacterized protein LOC126746280 n=1 Tax=Anthonomus grandis grandis TaxID=2921223 RepID=UPI0021656C66|nr:uncharacterized protein LOC126746280 [Anthonomus grandis grandis]